MKSAFSLLELVLVLAILGLIFSVAKFYPKDERLFMGASQILNDIIYTRSLALRQESFRLKGSGFEVATRQWYKSRWQLYFIRSMSATNGQQTYTIFLDKNGDGNANLGKTFINQDREIAVDILNPKKLMNSGQSGVITQNDQKASKRFNIEQNFGITRAEFKGSCSAGTRLIFDEYGRLYSPLRNAKDPYDKVLSNKQECVLKLSNKQNKNICIVIEPLTGYAYIPKFNNKNRQSFNLANKEVECSSL